MERKTIAYAVVALVLVVVGLVSGVYIGRRSASRIAAPVASERGHDDEAAGAHGGEAEHGHEGHGEGEAVKLTPEQAASAKIALAKVERRAETGLVEATAQIEAAADRTARVGHRINGRVIALKAGVGDRVKAGGVLAVIESPDLGRAKADYLAALATLEVARESAEREELLFEKKISSEKEWREAEAEAARALAEKEAAENRLHVLGFTHGDLAGLRVEGPYSSTIPVHSPIQGVVVERAVSLGQMVEPSDTLFVVMDLREVWIVVDVYERDVSQLRIGQNVRVKVAAYPTEEFRGTVQSIGAVVEPKIRAVKVRVALRNEEARLKPGMFAVVTIAGTAGEKHVHLFAPAAAIQRDGEKHIVFVPLGENEFQPRVVTLGHQAGDWVEIKEGLSEGETIVSTGSFALKSELKKEELGGGHSH